MTIGVLQPGYLPWLGCFAQVAACDVFVVYDCVQYDRESWRNRNRIRVQDGWSWLTVPVLSRGRFGQTVSEVRIDPQTPWQRSHKRTVAQAYRRAAFFLDHVAFLDELWTRTWDHLVALDAFAFAYMLKALGINTPVVQSSTLKLQGHRSERLLDACRKLGADHYLSTAAAEVYLDVPLFERHGIAVTFQRYQHPVYRQAHDGFISHLSGLDLLLNHGPASHAILLEAPGKFAGPEHLPRPDRRLAFIGE